MTDLTINRLQVISMKEFIDFIREDIKNTWCEISDESYTKWFTANEENTELYIDALEKLKGIIR